MERKGSSGSIKTARVYAILCAAVVFAILFLNYFGIFDNLEHATQDMRFRIRGVESHTDKIVIVGINQQTLDMLGIYGMPTRDYHAELIRNLFRAGAKAVLFDVLFLNLTGEKDSSDETGDLQSMASREDSILAYALEEYPNTIIARKMERSINASTPQTAGESVYPPAIFSHPKQVSFVDMFNDDDNYIRRAKLFSDDKYPQPGCDYSYALKAVLYACGADSAWLDTKKHIAHVGDTEIPLDADNFMIIDYAMDEETFQNTGGYMGMTGYISYEQVVDDSEYGIEALIKSGQLKDKVVLVGAAWPESGDTKNTPFLKGKLDKEYSPWSFHNIKMLFLNKNEYPMYGVHVHLNIATTILEKRFITPSGKIQFFLLVLLMGIVSTIINYRLKGYMGFFLSVVMIFVYSFTAIYLFIHFRRLIPVIGPAFATVTINYISAVTYNYIVERRQKMMIKGAFSQYVPPSVVGELLKNPEKLTLGGEERELSVIFSDVAGFTTISEGLTPTKLVELLNEYLTLMTDIVLSYDGIIDKYEGDAIMAEFGAPLPDEQHALKACWTALDMQEALRKLRDKLKAEGRPELRARVGINSGMMVVGNMGSSRIFDYTVMGDNVNLASRLEGANKAYGTYIMCSEATKKIVEDKIITRELDILRVKGKTTGVRVFEVMARAETGLSDSKLKMVDIYEKGLLAYKEKRWADGAALFTEALEIEPEDSPSKVYLERCSEYKDNPPPDDWDGIFTMRTK